MLLAIRFAVIDRGPALLRPADVPRSYKTSDAIARYKEQARQNVIEDARETAACLQPMDALVDPDHTGRGVQRPTGALAPWLAAVLYDPVVLHQTPVWTFAPKLVGRSVALSLLRLGTPQTPDWLFLGDRFRDPFRLLFGAGRFDRAACLASVGVAPEQDDSLEEQLRVLGQLVQKIHSDTVGGQFDYGEAPRPWGGDQ